MSNFEAFCKLYEVNLTQAVIDNPQDYGFGVERVPSVVEKMKEAFKRGSFNKDGRAIKATCRNLDIPYTYKGINEFISK